MSLFPARFLDVNASQVSARDSLDRHNCPELLDAGSRVQQSVGAPLPSAEVALELLRCLSTSSAHGHRLPPTMRAPHDLNAPRLRLSVLDAKLLKPSLLCRKPIALGSQLARKSTRGMSAIDPHDERRCPTLRDSPQLCSRIDPSREGLTHEPESQRPHSSMHCRH